MRTLLAGLAMCSGACVTDHHADPDPAPVVQPHSCVADVTLNGSSGSAIPTNVGPFTIDHNGVTLCLHLDATQNLIAAHFAAETEANDGTTSAFMTVLQDDLFSPLQDSWDVTVGENQPRTFANLEWNPPLHATTDALLWIHARGAAASTQVSVSLFEPLE